ncbi:CHAT domain-containing protein [Spirillospora sp. NPDC127506]
MNQQQIVAFLTRLAHQTSRQNGALAGGDDVAHAVAALVVAPDAEAKVALIERDPMLRTDQAEWLLARMADHVQTGPMTEQLSDISEYLHNTHTIMQSVRAGKLDVAEVRRIKQQYPVPDSPSSEDDSVRGQEQKGRQFLEEGRLDLAEATLSLAAEAARAAGEREVEGDAEIALFRVWSELAPEEGHGRLEGQGWRRMLAHARRAEAAYRAAGDSIGLGNALVAMTTVLVDHGEPVALDSVLDRLEEHCEPVARWWRRYARTKTARDHATLVDGLRWCRDNADLLGENADFYSQMCESKLAFFESRPVTVGRHMSPEFTALASLGLNPSGSDDELIERGEELVRAAGELHRRTLTQRVHRQISMTHYFTYLLHAKNLQRIRGAEAAVDALEAGTNRALLAQVWARELWVGAAQQPWARTEPRPTQLERLLGRYLTDRTPGSHSLLMTAFGKELTRRERQETTLLDQQRRTSHAAAGPLPVAQLRPLLQEEDAVVVYGANGSVYLITRNGCERIAEFQPDKNTALVKAGLSAMTGAGSEGTSALRQIADVLLAPVLDRVSAGARLYLVPHDSLWHLPLGHIGDEPLADSVAISYVPSLTLLAWQLTAPRLERTLKRFVGFGDGDGTLPHARQELAAAAALWSDSMVRTGKDMQFNPVVANMADADILHLACHGLYFPTHPDFSALHLCGPPQEPEVLWYSDLTRIKMNAELVVLASCHAGTGSVLPGSEYVGFPGAFLSAGARTVIAPLWAVDDHSTESLMGHFYRAYASTKSVAGALRTAQHALRADPETSHPRHWAAFQIFGAP